MAFTASQWLTRFTTISTSTALASMPYTPLASTAFQIYSFSAANVATTNARCYVDIVYNDGAGGTANLIRQLPIDPGAEKPINSANKHIIMASGFLTMAISATTAPCAFLMSGVEIT